MKILVILLFFIAPFSAQAALPVGEKISTVVLSGEEGGLVTGDPWDSKSMQGKIWLLFYVDPDEKSLNKYATKELGHLPTIPEVASVAVINLGATWLPNSLIESSLKQSQKEHPRTTYVKDVNKTLVKQWGVGDDTYNISLIDADSTVLFSKDGKLSPKDTKTLINTLKKAVVSLTGKPLSPSVQ